jgi:hypothetical protein
MNLLNRCSLNFDKLHFQAYHDIAYTGAYMSRDSALVMFFYMCLEKHVCNAMSYSLLFALAVVIFDQFRT